MKNTIVILMAGFLLSACNGPWRHPDGRLVTDEEKQVCAMEIARGDFGYGYGPMTQKSIMDGCLYKKGYTTVKP